MECRTRRERKRSCSHYLSRILGTQCDAMTISLLLSLLPRRYLCPLSSISLLFPPSVRPGGSEIGAAPDYPASFHIAGCCLSTHPSPAEKRCRLSSTTCLHPKMWKVRVPSCKGVLNFKGGGGFKVMLYLTASFLANLRSTLPVLSTDTGSNAGINGYT